MPAPYLISSRSAIRLRQILADGGQRGGRTPPGSQARGLTLVKVTGSPDVNGWQPGLVSVDRSGIFLDLTQKVLVKSPDGVTLAIGTRHPCTRTGDDATGLARFRSEPQISRGIRARKNTGSTIGPRPRINLIEGPGMLITLADDALDDEFDVTLSASGGATTMPNVTGSGCSVYASYTNFSGGQVGFSNENFDTDAYHSNVTNPNRITTPFGFNALFQVSACVEAGHTTQSFTATAFLLKNGVAFGGADVKWVDTVTTAGGNIAGALCGAVVLGVNDYVSLNVTPVGPCDFGITASLSVVLVGKL